MGYTNYWIQLKSFNQKQWQQIVEETYRIDCIPDEIEVTYNYTSEIAKQKGDFTSEEMNEIHIDSTSRDIETLVIKRDVKTPVERMIHNREYANTVGNPNMIELQDWDRDAEVWINFCKTNQNPAQTTVFHMLMFQKMLLGNDFIIARDDEFQDTTLTLNNMSSLSELKDYIISHIDSHILEVQAYNTELYKSQMAGLYKPDYLKKEDYIPTIVQEITWSVDNVETRTYVDFQSMRKQSLEIIKEYYKEDWRRF